MAFGPSGQLGHTLEPGLFVQARRLEVVGRNPYPQRAARGSLRDEGIEQLPAMAETSVGFVDPHQRELGNAGPGIAGSRSDGASFFIPQRKYEGMIVIARCDTPVVAVETFLD